MRNLDLTTLRSFVAVADSGGVTRAAGLLHLTQSAVSMQLKRLEDLLGLELLDRSGRGIALTAAGEQLLSYARRMVALNDEIIGRLTDRPFEGEIVLGVPHDIVYPAIPGVLQRFNAAYPKVRVQLIATNTLDLKARFARGECGLILTTEIGAGSDCETLVTRPLVWIGAPGGKAWQQSPLKLAFGRHCTFRPRVIAVLNQRRQQWELVVDSDSDRTIEATVTADLAVHAMIEGTEPPHLVRIEHGGALPELPAQKVNLYRADSASGSYVTELADLLRQAFRDETVDLKAVG